MLVAHAEQAGVWLVDGGMIRLAQALASLAQARGAQLRCDARVEAIAMEGGRARGVRLADGTRIDADLVVLNADRTALARGLFGEDVAAAAGVGPMTEPSLSAITLSGIGTATGFPLARHTVFFSRDYRAEFNALFRDGVVPVDPTVYVCAQDRDDRGELTGEASGADGERLFVLVNAPARGDDRPLNRQGYQRMRDAHSGSTGAVRPDADDDGASRGDAARLRTPVSGDRRRALRLGDARGDGDLRASVVPHETAGLVSGGRQRPPGAGGPDGGPLGTAGGAGDRGRLSFDRPVPPGGYAWWYLDALSDDGLHGLTIIVFIGSVFSPYYALARRRNPHADPTDHCVVNVALYGPRSNRWTMTERSRAHVRSGPDVLAIGPSTARWDGACFTIDIDEWAFPIPSRVRGTVRFRPSAVLNDARPLDDAGAHLWDPIAPHGDIDVTFDTPDVRWTGTGYLDHNRGAEPLERGFRQWTWSRMTAGTQTLIAYEGLRRNGDRFALGLRVGRDGQVEKTTLPPMQAMRASRWRLPMSARSDAGTPPRLVRRFEDAPFYARSLIEAQFGGTPARGVHETLSLDRFANPVVQAMLPFRMPRRA